MKPSKPDGWKLVGFASIPVFIIAIIVLSVLNITTVFNPPALLLLCNTIFLGLIPVFVSYFAYQSYRRSGSDGILLVGAGFIILGIGSIATGMVSFLPDSRNLSITLYNTAICAGALFQMAGIFVTFFGPDIPGKKSAFRAAMVYAGSVLAFVLVSLTAAVGVVPPFVDAGGSTLIRGIVLAGAVEFLLIAAALLFRLFFQKRKDFFFYFAIGLVLFALGLIAASSITVLGTPLNWLARVGQYVGAIFILIAFLALWKDAEREHVPVPDMLSRFFGESDTGFGMLVANAPDAIAVFRDDRFQYVNEAALRLWGVSSFAGISAIPVSETVPKEDRAVLADRVRLLERNMPVPEREMRIARPDGTIAYVSIRSSPIVFGGEHAVLSILRDISERRKTEAAFRESEERYRSLFAHMLDGFAYCRMLYDEQGRPEDFVYLAVNDSFTRLTGLTDVVGRRVTQVIPKIKELNPELLETYSRVAQSGLPETFEINFKPLSLNLVISVYSPEKDHFVAVFNDITERRKTEDALRESERTKSVLLDKLNEAQQIGKIGSWEWNIRTNELWWSHETYRIFGVTAEAYVPDFKSNAKFVHPEDLSRYYEAFERSLKAQEPLDFDLRLVTPDGDVKYCNAKGQVICDQAGKPIRFTGTVMDITGRKRAEEGQERLQTLMDHNPCLVFLKDEEGRYVYLNETYERQFVHRKDWQGKTDFDFWPEESAALFRENDRAVLAAETTSQFLEDSVDLGGTRHIWLNYKFPFVDAQGRRFVGGIGIDVTERVQIEKAFQESEARFRELAESAGNIILRFNPAGKITYFNEYAEKFFGFPREEILGKPAVGTILPASESGSGRDMDAMVKDIVANPDRYETNENENTKKNGERVWIRWTNRPVFNPDGTIREFTTIGIDITDRKRAEMAADRESARLAILADASGMLLSSRTPEQIVQTICDRVAAHLDCDFFFNYLIEDDGKRLRLNAYKGIPPEEADRIEFLEYGVAVCGCVARDGARIVAEDVQHAGDPRTELVRSFGVAAYACHPLLYLGKPIGTLSFGTKTRAAFVPEDLELMRAVTDLVATAMARKKAEQKIEATLAEREILLAEIHHRVKNNLTAFISLLSLEGTYDASPASVALKKDLQNRARSMALIHETLYRTRNFAEVDMEMYLGTLTEQIVTSYNLPWSIQTTIDAKGITLDLARATPVGLIVNELLTNTLKYAWPDEGAGTAAGTDGPPAIGISLSRRDGQFVLTVRDNGRGLPDGIDPVTTKSLGLKLVNFLAKHQLRAQVVVKNEGGAVFTLRFREEPGKRGR